MDYHWDVLEVFRVGKEEDEKLFWLFNDNGTHCVEWRDSLDWTKPKQTRNSYEHHLKYVDVFIEENADALAKFIAVTPSELTCRGKGSKGGDGSSGCTIQITLKLKHGKQEKTILLHNYSGSFDCECDEVEALGSLLLNWKPAGV